MDGLGLHQAYIDTGVQGTFNLLKAATINKVRKFVNVSSVSAYGIVTEDDGSRLKKRISEDMSGRHFLHYGITKLSGENYCKIGNMQFCVGKTNPFKMTPIHIPHIKKRTNHCFFKHFSF